MALEIGQARLFLAALVEREVSNELRIDTLNRKLLENQWEKV
jgi:hypothetical protein